MLHCTLQNFCIFIGARNDLLAIDVRLRGNESVLVLCRLLRRFGGSASCVVMYTILPYTNVYYTATSECIGRAEDIVPVVLSRSVEPNTALSIEAYTVGGQQDVKVEGIYNTGNMHGMLTVILNDI